MALISSGENDLCCLIKDEVVRKSSPTAVFGSNFDVRLLTRCGRMAKDEEEWKDGRMVG